MVVGSAPVIRYVKVETPTRFRSLEVIRTERITPHMMRVTLGGPEIASFISLGADDDIRMQLPVDFSRTPLPPVIEFNPWRLVYPEGAPEAESRAYTIRSLNHEAGEMVLDMVLHGEGLATRWAEQARPGHVVTVAGPWGSRRIEGTFAHYLLLGDETALPAIGRTVEGLPAGANVTVLVEVASLDDAQSWSVADRVTINSRWLVRGPKDRPGRNSLLLDAIASMVEPAGPCFVFGAGESSTLREVRRYIVANWRVDRKHLNLAGYWKREDDHDDWFYHEDEGEAE